MPLKDLVSSLHQCACGSFHRDRTLWCSRHPGSPCAQPGTRSQGTELVDVLRHAGRPLLNTLSPSHPLWFRLQSNYPSEQLWNSQVTSIQLANGVQQTHTWESPGSWKQANALAPGHSLVLWRSDGNLSIHAPRSMDRSRAGVQRGFPSNLMGSTRPGPEELRPWSVPPPKVDKAFWLDSGVIKSAL